MDTNLTQNSKHASLKGKGRKGTHSQKRKIQEDSADNSMNPSKRRTNETSKSFDVENHISSTTTALKMNDRDGSNELQVSTPSPPVRTTENIQKIFHSIIETFWNDDDVEPLVAIPFFSVITKSNCHTFGTADYFSKVNQACTLATMKVCIYFHLPFHSSIIHIPLLLFPNLLL